MTEEPQTPETEAAEREQPQAAVESERAGNRNVSMLRLPPSCVEVCRSSQLSVFRPDAETEVRKTSYDHEIEKVLHFPCLLQGIACDSMGL